MCFFRKKKIISDELKYLLSISHIGIVNYGKYDTNNRFCASGKIYEYLFEGIPVVTTENEPLVDFCKNNHVGIADDQYINGIKKILESYEKYIENVSKYKEYDVMENNEKLLKKILFRLSKGRGEI